MNLSHTLLCFLYIYLSWEQCGSQRTIWSPQASTASSSSQARTDLAPHTPVCVCACVCGPDWMTVVMTQSFLWAACFLFFFSKVAALPSRQSRRGEESPVEKGRQKHTFTEGYMCVQFFLLININAARDLCCVFRDCVMEAKSPG